MTVFSCPPHVNSIRRATITWYDAPNVEGTTTKALINNIDLSLTSPSQRT
jgi:hypothetical protein